MEGGKKPSILWIRSDDDGGMIVLVLVREARGSWRRGRREA